jgi:dienelactone hydrolase
VLKLRYPLELLVAMLALVPLARAAVNESIEAITIDGHRERALVVHDDARPVNDVLIVFTGGDGHLGLTDALPRSGGGPGYVATLRRDVVRPGTALVLVDSPARQPRMSVEYRESPEHRAWVEALIAALRSRFAGARLIAVGYSNGAVSALVAGRQPGVGGVILISGIFRLYADLASFGVAGPILVVHHDADRCVPPEFDESFRRVLKPTMIRSIAQPYEAPPCGPVSAHQFFGQETVVAEIVHGWLATGRAPLRAR